MEKWQRAATRLIQLQHDIFATEADLEGALRAVVDGAAFVIPEAEGVAIEFVEGDERVYRIGVGLGEVMLGLRQPVASGLAGIALSTSQPQLCRDALADPRLATDLSRYGTRSMIAAPLPRELDPRGVLKLLSSRPDAFDQRDLTIAQMLVAPLHHVALRARAADSARIFEATFEQAAVGMAHVTPEGSFIRVNRRFCEIAGYSAAELRADGFQRITYPDDLEADLLNVAALIEGRIADYAMEKRYVRKDGALVWVNLTVALIRKADGSPDFMVSVIEDISLRKNAESLASYDPLTGLPNRRVILDRLDQMLAHQARGGGAVGLAFLDLDNFKSVNDRHGHVEGDRCLVAIAEEFNRGTRKQDLLGRYGGDEFVLVMADVAEQEAGIILTRLGTSIGRLARDNDWNVGVSIGAAIAGNAEIDADSLLLAADELMYRAKHGDERVVIGTLGAGRSAN